MFGIGRASFLLIVAGLLACVRPGAKKQRVEGTWVNSGAGDLAPSLSYAGKAFIANVKDGSTLTFEFEIQEEQARADRFDVDAEVATPCGPKKYTLRREGSPLGPKTDGTYSVQYRPKEIDFLEMWT